MGRHRLVNFIATVTVLSVMLLTLVGLTTEQGSTPAEIAAFVIHVVSVVGAVAVLIGILNLLVLHLGRMSRGEHGWPYSLVVLIGAALVVVLRVLDRQEVWSGDLEGEQMSTRLFEAVQVSLESALAALLVFFLIYAAFRLLRRRVTLPHILFLVTMEIVLVGWIPLKNVEVLRDIQEWVIRVPVSAGARGLLIGVGLGTVMVGVRVLVGQDRSFRG